MRFTPIDDDRVRVELTDDDGPAIKLAHDQAAYWLTGKVTVYRRSGWVEQLDGDRLAALVDGIDDRDAAPPTDAEPDHHWLEQIGVAESGDSE